jgi:transposase InsO family protein
MCKLLRVSSSSYYDWLKQQLSPIKLRNQELSKQIKILFMNSRCTYGTRRLKKNLCKVGCVVSRRRIGKLMKDQQLSCKAKRQFKLTTDSRHSLPVAKNILKRNFTAYKTNQTYVGDITYIVTQEGWLYLATVIDLYSRRVVGWAMDEHMQASLVNKALLMAIWNRKPKCGLLWHTDRGSQYASDSHRQILKDHGIKQSMSRSGDCWDNAVAESFFHTIKVELVYKTKFKTRDEAKQAIFEYIEVFYNRKRMHSANDYLSPLEYEMANKCF